ncbi:voltage-dependent calcium channel gamma-2 subunit-like [Xiphias gladius]|uniref:voltage-dependent calcium channel gamma-2 subunit-like n=1 Tax=Xiphias gladius TaxID=8245 RepID=UPI001A9A12D9|nr:voltage-dependent calcium channel gamma-2 subunit-like [Xiphias gladius]
MGVFDRGVQMLLTTVGAFAAFSLMTIAVGTDYWLYSRGVCKIKSTNENETSKKNEEVMTHSGLWRTCCLEGSFKGMCKQIDHFPEDADYEADASEYFLRAVRASSIFPILSVILLFMGGLCIAASEFYKSRHNIILSAGILFVSAGMNNIKFTAMAYRAALDNKFPSKSKTHTNDIKLCHAKVLAYCNHLEQRRIHRELSMYTLPKGQTGTPTATYNSTERDHNFLQVHNCIQKDLKDSGGHSNTANRRTTPV